MLTREVGRGASGWSYWPWHTLLIAAFPVLFLFGENVDQQVTLEPLWVPLWLSLAGGAVLLAICVAARREWARGGLIASALLALFFSYGHVWNLVEGLLGQRWLLTAIWVALAAFLVLVASRGGAWVRPATQLLNIAAALLVVFNVFRIGEYTAAARLFPRSTGEIPTVSVGDAGRPDVYYIILDRYANEVTLRDVYDYDNRPFLDELGRRGFDVAHDSWANYFKTAFSVVSSLSMEHVDPDGYNQATPHTFGPIHSALQGRLAVPATFKTLGYEYVHIGNWWEPSSENVDADVVLRYTQDSEFGSALAATTMLLVLAPNVAPDEDPETIDYSDLARAHVLFGFDAILRAAERDGPTFTFAHLTIPHPPYVFDTDGSMPTPGERAARPETEEYSRQVEWANSRTLEVLDTILDVPPGEPDPIVILQSDEGPWPPGFTADQDDFNWLRASDAEIAWKYGILNAYRMPEAEVGALGFHDRITPVNVFRILFNAYFGTHLELLPDTIYLSPDYDHMYDLVEYERPD